MSVNNRPALTVISSETLFLSHAHLPFSSFSSKSRVRGAEPLLLWVNCGIRIFTDFRQNHLLPAGDKKTLFQNDCFDNPESREGWMNSCTCEGGHTLRNVCFCLLSTSLRTSCKNTTILTDIFTKQYAEHFLCKCCVDIPNRIPPEDSS